MGKDSCLCFQQQEEVSLFSKMLRLSLGPAQFPMDPGGKTSWA